jgi:hypothetical protein
MERTDGKRGRNLLAFSAWALVTLALCAWRPPAARACGCFTPPAPPPNPDVEKEYAVNQQSEQIIFEVRDGRTTAHILIRYEGNPEEFAWLLPVPTPPELDLSETMAFGVVNLATSPQITVRERSLCPSPQYVCTFGGGGGFSSGGGSSGGGGCGFGGASSDSAGWAPTDASFSADGAGWYEDASTSVPAGVEVLERLVVGPYDIITFQADDAALAIGWLQDEGFIVNETTIPFLEPCIEAGMVLIAVKLLPDAEATAIRPLMVTYDSPVPMIPLRITAVAAEPELTVTAMIFHDRPYVPRDRPLVTIPDGAITADRAGRINYPMALSRAIDEAGGDGFIVEYVGQPPGISDPSGCCASGWDSCGLGGDGVCQCPSADFDRADCGEEEDIVRGLEMVERLSSEHAVVTRLTTRLSPHEMTFDPIFVPVDAMPGGAGRLQLEGLRLHVDECRSDVRDPMELEAIEARQQCATTYCGEGRCAVTDRGAGCRCAPGFVARQFQDLDGLPSITCIPEEPIVDYAAGGLVLKDPCANLDCGLGECLDIGGFAACRCGTAATAVVDARGTPRCLATRRLTSTPGAEDYTADMESLEVCWPVPPTTCGPNGWLVTNPNRWIQGASCELNQPDPALLTPPPTSSSTSSGCGGSGCGVAGTSAGLANLLTALSGLLLARVLRRRRPRRRSRGAK